MAGGLAWNQYQAAQRTALGNERARADARRQRHRHVLPRRARRAARDRRLALGRRRATRPRCSGTSAASSAATAARSAPASAGWTRPASLRVSTSRGAVARRLDVSDRSYFRKVIATGKPYVSEGITSRTDGARVIVMAVPTRDASGRVTGVLAAALLGRPFAITKGSLDLGGAGVDVLDRDGRSVLGSAPDPSNAAWSRCLRGAGHPARHPRARRIGRPCRRLRELRHPRLDDRHRPAARGALRRRPSRLLPGARARGRVGVGRALPDRVRLPARPPRGGARARARRAAPRPQPHPRQRLARQRGLGRPRRRARRDVPGRALHRRARGRGSPRVSSSRPWPRARSRRARRATSSWSPRQRRWHSTPGRRS